jgi:hypothetical protein
LDLSELESLAGVKNDGTLDTLAIEGRETTAGEDDELMLAPVVDDQCVLT